ncbi:MAG: hypothetical protein GX938_07415 [Spirochaetales bacterium]|nr:hypothetical protein [Spirochaetales bacterium]
MLRLLLLLLTSAGATALISVLALSFFHRSGAFIKDELVVVQSSKRGTPVIGGAVFVLATLLTTLFDPLKVHPMVWLPTLALTLFGLIGLFDDLIKQHLRSADGLPSLVKLGMQTFAGIIVLVIAWQQGLIATSLDLGFTTLTLGRWYYPFALLLLLYFVNAVNITDGLDSLAAGSSLPLFLLVVATALNRETPTSTALLGAVVIFLLFNIYPARYFMGDLGSHAIGAYIGISALLLKAELMLLFASGIFLVELASSLIQIISIRRFGKKVFTIAPLHHAYELKGVGETTIVRRFVLLSWVYGALSLLILW